MTASKPSPAPLRAIAWLSVVMGVLMALSSVMGLLLAAAVPAAMPQAAAEVSALLGSGVIDSKDMRETMDQAMAMFHYLGVLSVAQLPLAVIVLWAGVDLLRLRAWARTANEVFCWLTLACLALYAVYALWQWFQAPALQAPGMQDLLGIDPAALRTIVLVTEAVMLAVFIVPTVVVLRYLRGPEARAAVAGR